jgi:hypothetical protein
MEIPTKVVPLFATKDDATVLVVRRYRVIQPNWISALQRAMAGIAALDVARFPLEQFFDLYIPSGL